MDRSRGQILLVAAFSLALIFVSLALILNTAIFTENLATRETTSGDDALDFRGTTLETGTVLLNSTNYEDGSFSELNATYANRIDNFSEISNVHAVARGTLLSVTVAGTTEGAVINQSADSSFENASAVGNETGTWQLVDGVTDVRKATLSVTNTPSDEPLVLNATNGSETWSLSITDQGNTFKAVLNNPNGTETERTYDTDSLHVRPTNGTINGTRGGETWSALQFQEAIAGSFDLWITNGTNASGTYRMIVDTPADTIADSNYGVSPNDPQVSAAIYSATLDLDLSRADLEYSTQVVIEPEGSHHR